MTRFRLFFTPAGSAVLVIALIMLIRSLLARNSYEILLASSALFFLLIIGAIGAWKAAKLKLLEPGWKPPFPMTANAGKDTLVTGLAGSQSPLFFRMHFKVRGIYYPSGSSSGCYVSAETSVPRKEEQVFLPLDFPMSGVFMGDGFCRLRDIFGLYSFACGTRVRKTIKIRNAPCFGKEFYINPQSGAEDRRNKHSNDEERYYMREYTPGDRLRDINWKSSEKIDALITRISPDNQEKVSRIAVHFRNFGPVDKPSLEALWLLDRAKARLSFFLRSLKEQQSSFIFDVLTAHGSTEIKDEDDLDSFLEELAGMSFCPVKNETTAAFGPGDLYVFSTACDSGLPAFLLSNSRSLISLYLVQPKSKTDIEFETLKKFNFPAKGCLLMPRWLLKNKIKPISAGSFVVKAELIYAETRL